MKFDFTVLGSGAAAPTKERNPSSYLIEHHNKSFLIDCGEGTQMQFLKFGIKFQKIEHIFISHLHGDHFFGLIGLISTLHLLGRTKDLHVYCPKPLEDIINQQLSTSDTQLRFKIHFHYLNFEDKQLLFQNTYLEIFSFPLKHGIDCCGFQFTERKLRPKINKTKMPHYLSVAQISELLEGKDLYDENGKILFKNKELTLPPDPQRKFSFCSDTMVDSIYQEYIKKSDLLYHETTFLDELKDRATATNHSTALQVGKLASKCEIKQLIIGHFSARYKNLSKFIAEVELNFSNVQLAEEGRTYNI